MSVVVYTLGSLLVAGVATCVFRLYLRATRGVCNSTEDLTGKTVIITGPTSGIGIHTAIDLASRNAKLILACRDISKGASLKRRIALETGNPNVSVYELDISLMNSVRSFVKKFLDEESRCDILINNAGITGFMSKKTTAEGMESIYATNYFGPFLLTNLLLEQLKKSAPSRIVNVSSLAHIWGKVELNNLNSETSYSLATAYNGSKLALIMFTRELSKRLKDIRVTANSLHPGTINTNLFMNMPGFLRIPLHSIGYFFFKTPEEGAQTTLYCAVAPEVEGVSGRYFSECAVTSASTKALDDQLCLQLWEKTVEITGLKLD